MEIDGWAPNHQCKKLADINLVVREGITIRIICKCEILAVAKTDCQTAKFNSPTNFPATCIQ